MARHPDSLTEPPLPTAAEVKAYLAEIAAERAAMVAAVGGRAVDFDCDAAGHLPTCTGCAVSGPHACTEDHVGPAAHAACEVEARRLAVLRDGAPCHDCAFLRRSEESRMGLTARIAAQADPFHCHQAMPLDGKGRVPEDGDFKPRDHRAYPICAGWAAARAQRRTMVFAARAAGKIWRSLVRPASMRERVLLQLVGVTPKPSPDKRRLRLTRPRGARRARRGCSARVIASPG